MRYPKVGYNDDALTTDAYSILEPEGITPGRVFWLRGLVISNEDAVDLAVVEIFDEAEAGTPGAPTAAAQRLNIQVTKETTVILEFPSPGIKFAAGLTAVISAGTINAYSVYAIGYEE